MTLNPTTLRGDLFGGLTAAIVALPLALAFGVSSGAGAMAGLYGAICVGFFAALFGGTSTQVSGPTGPMTVVMAALFTEFAALDPDSGFMIAFTVVMMAGAIQILFGLFKLGGYITLVPFPVISGFMTGIGTIIILIELGPLLGHHSAANALEALQALPAQLSAINSWALALGALSLAIILLTPTQIASKIPPALLALFVGTLIAVMLPGEAHIEIIGEIPTGLPELHLPAWNSELLIDMLSSAVILAALGSIDSLLTSLVADNLTKTQHNSDKELIGQGIGNLAAGFVGGLPGAGATMRTVVNIRAGGTTRISGAFHALVLFAIVMGLGGIAQYIPHAVLSGILIKVGLDIIDWPFLKRLHHMPPVVTLLTLIVLGLTLFVDLITAVLVGMFVANLITVKRLSHIQIQGIIEMSDRDHNQKDSADDLDLLHQRKSEVAAYQFTGPVSYAASHALLERIKLNDEHQLIWLDFTDVPIIDVSTALAFENLIKGCAQSGQEVWISGANPSVLNVFDRLKLHQHLGDEAHFEQKIHAFDALRRRYAEQTDPHQRTD